jgi:UDP-4-amino-4,6-dideoxy-N-acetyl-beta-L-altrosamine transaminase
LSTRISDRQYSYGRHWIDEVDINAVSENLRKDYLSQGPAIDQLEKEFADYCGAKYCLAVSSGTAGLHLACYAAGFEKGQEAWTSTLTFAATANAIRYTGADFGLIDIDSHTYNISAKTIQEQRKLADKDSKVPSGLVAVHFGGSSCNMQEIDRVASNYQLSVVEDACHALGGSYGGKPIGSCQYSYATVFSLHPVKSITSGEGGLIVTNEEEAYLKMKRARSHGISKGNSAEEPWRAEAISEGFNYRITEMQCALALSQLKKLESFVAKRRALVQIYKEQLRGLPISPQHCKSGESAWHIFSVRFDFDALGVAKRVLYDRMLAKGVTMAVQYLPIHMHHYFKKKVSSPGSYQEAERYYDSAFSLPLHCGLQEDDIVEICRRLRESLG